MCFVFFLYLLLTNFILFHFQKLISFRNSAMAGNTDEFNCTVATNLKRSSTLSAQQRAIHPQNRNEFYTDG